MAWPPQVNDVKADLGIEITDTRDDANLQVVLDAAVQHVELHRHGDFDFTGSEVDADGVALTAPTAGLILGTIRLAGRWHARRRSPDATIDAGEFGTVRVPGIDLDIQRLLGIGNYRRPLVG